MALGRAGETVLWLTLVLAVYGGLAAAGSLRWRRAALLESAGNAAGGVAALASLGVALLLYALLEHDFSLRYVAQHSSRDAPLAVTLTGLWAGQAGSLLFWAWGWPTHGGPGAGGSAGGRAALLPGALVELYGVLAFFFRSWPPSPAPSPGPPPPQAGGVSIRVLWDDGMRIHPPLLLIGYMSFSVPTPWPSGPWWGGGRGRSGARVGARGPASRVGGRLRGDDVVPLRRWDAGGLDGAGGGAAGRGLVGLPRPGLGR